MVERVAVERAAARAVRTLDIWRLAKWKPLRLREYGEREKESERASLYVRTIESR